MIIIKTKQSIVNDVRKTKIKKMAEKYLLNQYLKGKLSYEPFYIVGLGIEKDGKIELKKLLKVDFSDIIRALTKKQCKLNLVTLKTNEKH